MLKREISISLRLTLWFGGIFLTGWALFGMSMWLNLRSTLRDERRQTLSRRLDRLQELMIKDQTSAAHDRFQDFSDFAHATGNGLAEVLYPNGTRAFPSPSAAAATFPWPTLQPEGVDVFITVQTAGQSYWVMSRQVDLLGQTVVLLVAAPEAGNLLVLQAFIAGLLASAPILLLVSSAGGYWVSRRALMPVDRIAATARSISIANISERIPVTQTGDELQRHTETCNSMLDRLESSVSQIKRFTADASHELRGPLSFTRTVAEIALRNPHADMESRRALQDIVDEAEKAAVLLEDMLALARADAAPIGICQSQVDLMAILEEVCEIARPIAKQQNLTLSPDFGRGKVFILGDPAALKRLLWILLDNALKYSSPQGTVNVSLSRIAGQGSVVVRDNGIGISATDLPFVFDRFYRADPSRSMVEGNGLGLAIAKWIAEAHRAELSVESEEGVGTSFTILFPSLRMSTPTEIVGEAAPSLKQLAI